jgi:hypothetical protein
MEEYGGIGATGKGHDKMDVALIQQKALFLKVFKENILKHWRLILQTKLSRIVIEPYYLSGVGIFKKHLSVIPQTDGGGKAPESLQGTGGFDVTV